MTGSGAQRKHVILPTDFRSPSVNGHSRYGQLTARFAPKPTSTPTSRMVLSVDEKSQIQALDGKQPSCR